MDKVRWRQIENLYYEVLERSPVERAVFLERECAEDSELFAEITTLLSSSEKSGDFLAESDFPFALQLINSPQRSLHTGDGFGKYKIIKFLGCGGMGEVYLAHDSALKRKVALKLLPPGIAADETRVRRFQIEARAASRIVQRNVAQVYEVGETQGIHFIAMEFVDGATLRAHLNSGNLSPEQALPLAKQIAAALAAAHEVGVIHRDLKPENIMLRPDGEVKVLDFSLAKLTRRASPANGSATGYDSSFLTNSFKTEPGFLMGTATYMSPEQARGQEVDVRTDVWSFGVVLYEMLKGEPPFRGATGMDTIAAVLTAEFKPLDRNTDEIFNKLSHIIHRALRKEPAERYQSVAELIDDLDRKGDESKFLSENFNPDKNVITADQIVKATDEIRAATNKNPRNAAQSDWRTKDKGFSVFGVRPVFIAAVILLLTALGGWWFSFQRPPSLTGQNTSVSDLQNSDIKSIAVLPFKTINIEAEENLEIGMADALINRLGSLGQFTIRPTAAVKKFARQDVDPIIAGQELKVDAVLEGNIQRNADKLRVTVQMIDVRNGELLWTNSFDENVSGIFKMQENISARVAQSLSSKLPRKEIQSGKYQENTEAYRAYLKGQFHADREIEEEMIKAAKYYRQAIEIDPTYAPAYVGLANYYADNYGEAKTMSLDQRMGKARELTLKALELDESLAAAHVSLASILMHLDWNWEEAGKEYRRAIELNPNLARAHHGYAYYLVFTGHFDEAIASIQRAQEIDPVSTRVARDIGSINVLARRYDVALAAFNNAYEMDRELLTIHMNRGFVYLHQKKYRQAIIEFQAAVRDKPDYLDAYSSLGEAYGLNGQKEKALKTLAEMQRRAAGRKIWTYYLIRIYVGLGDKDKAFYWLEKGMEDRSIGIRLKVDPHFDSLRDDPRFDALVRRVGFPE